MKQILKIATFLSLCALTACSELPSKTGSDGTPSTAQETVSLCYTGQTTTVEDLQRMALSFCPEGTTQLEVWDHDTFFNDCPISKKNRITYRCLGYKQQ